MKPNRFGLVNGDLFTPSVVVSDGDSKQTNVFQADLKVGLVEGPTHASPVPDGGFVFFRVRETGSEPLNEVRIFKILHDDRTIIQAKVLLEQLDVRFISGFSRKEMELEG